jgi:hypothetical protein
MKKIFVILFLFSILLAPYSMSGQSIEIGNSEKAGYFLIDDALYIQGDSSMCLDSWIEQGLHILFTQAGNDSLIISIDIGGRDKVYFMGMAVAIDNPGFIASNSQAEFYHWIFISRIKEGINNAYIHKEYVDESLEQLGYKLYFINILFPDQTEFQFCGYELKDG